MTRTIEDKRPVWDFKELSEEAFRRIHKLGRIESVRSGYTMTSVDPADEWLEVKCCAGKKRAMPLGWQRVWTFVGRWSVTGLFELTPLGERMADRADAIDIWEAENKWERATYERLKKKFGGGA